MMTVPLRLLPGQDLRAAIAAVPAAHGLQAGFVLQGIGSLSVAQLRLAGASSATEIRGELEILTLAGSTSPDGAHLHMALSDADGRVMGGHVAPGCLIRTTAEILLVLLPHHQFSRPFDPVTGYAELAITSQGSN